jgi:hypothetical protein
MIKEIFLALILVVPAAMAMDANSSDIRAAYVEINGGGTYSNSSDLSLFSSLSTVSGAAKAGNKFLCLGYLCFSLEQINIRPTVTFILGTNATDTERAAVDEKSAGFYWPYELNKYFACVEDAGVTNTPTFGIVFSGQQLNYIEIENTTTNYILRMSQIEEDNKFLLPATVGGCSNIGSKLPMFTLSPFVPGAEQANSIEMFLSYPFVDIIGNYQKSGKISVVLEKNNTNQIIVDVI